MEQRIRSRFSSEVLSAACARYGVAPDALRALDGFESFIYDYDLPVDRAAGDARSGLVLRLSHGLRRTEGLIRGEIDWINYLALGGTSVAQAVPSPAGHLVEPVEDGQGGVFWAATFVRAEGQLPWEAGWTPALYQAYGRLIGRMHAMTKDYMPPCPEWRRPEWDDEIFEFVDHFLPRSETIARQRYAEVLAHLRTLPRGREDYGLCHQDAHGGNMHVDHSGRLILFDFDDCGYNWFANDIAIVLFYIAMGRHNTPAFAREFLAHFLRGYEQENALGVWWLRELPWFLKLREIEMYAVIYRDFEIPGGDVSAIDDAWAAAYMAGRKARIEESVPYLDMDYAVLRER